MKKIKRFLSALSAIAVMAAGTISASAAYNLDILDDIAFSYKESRPDSSVKYIEHFITNNGFSYKLYADSSSLVVKMKDDSRLPEDNNVDVTAQECTKYQKKYFKNMQNPLFETSRFNEIEPEDNVYIVNGFSKGYSAVAEYCEKLMENENVEFAEPLVLGTYNYIFSDPDPVSNYFENKYGINVDDFDSGNFIFSVLFEDAKQAESFDPDCVEGLKERLHAMKVKDNTVYIQFDDSYNDDMFREMRADMAYKLTALQNIETVKGVYFTVYGGWEETGNIGGAPGAYDMGDVNFDKKFDFSDVICLAKGIVKQAELTEEQRLIADVNDDGRVNVFDVISLSRKLLS